MYRRLVVAIDETTASESLQDMTADVGAMLGAKAVQFVTVQVDPPLPIVDCFPRPHFMPFGSGGFDPAMLWGFQATAHESAHLTEHSRTHSLKRLVDQDQSLPAVSRTDASIFGLLRMVRECDLVCLGRMPGKPDRSGNRKCPPCVRVWNVLRHSTSPLLICSPDYKGLRRIVAACDGRSGIEEMIEWGRRWKLALKLPLTIAVAGTTRDQLDSRLKIATNCLERLALDASCLGYVCAAQELPKRLAERDLLLINRSSGWWPLRPCIAKKIVGTAPGPVAVLPANLPIIDQRSPTIALSRCATR